MGREAELRQIAYHIWEEQGYCHGHDMEEWLKAEVVWEEQHKQGSVSEDIKVESKRVVKQAKNTGASTRKPKKVS